MCVCVRNGRLIHIMTRVTSRVPIYVTSYSKLRTVSLRRHIGPVTLCVGLLSSLVSKHPYIETSLLSRDRVTVYPKTDTQQGPSPLEYFFVPVHFFVHNLIIVQSKIEVLTTETGDGDDYVSSPVTSVVLQSP